MDTITSGITPLRHRMLEDMRMRKMERHTQEAHVRAVRRFARSHRSAGVKRVSSPRLPWRPPPCTPTWPPICCTRSSARWRRCRPPEVSAVGRPSLEVADIFCQHAPAWRAEQRGHLSLAQLKVFIRGEAIRAPP